MALKNIILNFGGHQRFSNPKRGREGEICCLGALVEQGLHVLLKPGKQLSIPYQAVLYDLRDARGMLPAEQQASGRIQTDHRNLMSRC